MSHTCTAASDLDILSRELLSGHIRMKMGSKAVQNSGTSVEFA